METVRLRVSQIASCALLCLAACSQPIEHTTPPAVEVVAAPPTDTAAAAPVVAPVEEPAAVLVTEPVAAPAGWSFSPHTAADEKGWYPIRDGVTVALAGDGAAMEVSYRRESGTAAGVAFDLAPGSCTALDTIALRLSAAAKQRLWVCLTDAQGVVWSFPSIQATAEATLFTLAAADVRPDPFQNSGKQVPEQPDWAEMQMLTILDISGFMGASAVDCVWRIESVCGTEVAR
jgi:hypothetical protein